MSQINRDADALVIALMHDTADATSRAALADLMDDIAVTTDNRIASEVPMRADHFALVASWLRGDKPLSVKGGMLRVGTYGFAFEIPAEAYTAWAESLPPCPDLFSDEFVNSIS